MRVVRSIDRCLGGKFAPPASLIRRAVNGVAVAAADRRRASVPRQRRERRGTRAAATHDTMPGSRHAACARRRSRSRNSGHRRGSAIAATSRNAAPRRHARARPRANEHGPGAASPWPRDAGVRRRCAAGSPDHRPAGRPRRLRAAPGAAPSRRMRRRGSRSRPPRPRRRAVPAGATTAGRRAQGCRIRATTAARSVSAGRSPARR